MKFILAPLADYTDSPFRVLCREGGADFAYTEMISAAAIAHGHLPTRIMMERLPGDSPLGCQIFGADEGDIAIASREASKMGFDELNLNAGCPMPNVTRCGAGAKLVETPEKIGRLLRVMKENTDLPITLKTRLGPNPQRTTIYDIVGEAEAAGAKGIAIHARYTNQLHGGPVLFDTLADVVSKTKLPVIGNGSIQTSEDVARFSATGVAGVMIGRAALKDPYIFARLKNLEEVRILEGMELFNKHLDNLKRFHDVMTQKHADLRLQPLDGYVALKVRTHLFKYLSGRPNAAHLRAALNGARTISEIHRLLEVCSPYSVLI